MATIISGKIEISGLETVEDYFSLAYLITQEVGRQEWDQPDGHEALLEELAEAFTFLAERPWLLTDPGDKIIEK